MNDPKYPLKVRGNIVKIASFRDEADLDPPEIELITNKIIGSRSCKIDIFTFCQRIPDRTPRYDFYYEWESIAALDYVSHKNWMERILNDKTRNMIRKAVKKGVITKSVDFSDELVNGIVEIYNESPVRQGRLFKHYGKSFFEVQRANSTHLERSVFIGAFHDEKLIGFVKLVFGDRTARAEQIISMLRHRDKAPTNALLDRAVLLCEERQIPYMIYGVWPQKESFAQFKKNNGFVRVDLPRYFIPLSAVGRIGLRLRLHREVKNLVPEALKIKLAELRERWYKKRYDRN